MSGATNQPKTEQESTAPQMVLAPPPPDVFANQFRMGVTMTDFNIVFATTLVNAAGHPLIMEKIAVNLAPGMIKQLLLQLKYAVAAYEEAIGEIKVPRHLEENLRKMQVDLKNQLATQMESAVNVIMHPMQSGA